MKSTGAAARGRVIVAGGSIAGLFAGEHVAATEFVIGALLVSFGASARDIVLGLLLGNLLAVLSWTLLCAPIAVGTRLTLYWYLRRIAGPGVTLYREESTVAGQVTKSSTSKVSGHGVAGIADPARGASEQAAGGKPGRGPSRHRPGGKPAQGIVPDRGSGHADRAAGGDAEAAGGDA